MKIAITGAEGKIGSRLLDLGAEPLLCDVTDREGLNVEIGRVKPNVILHLAAQTDIDWCQAHEWDAITANVYGTSLVCQTASELVGEGRVAVISSDQVFDGKKGHYKENDEPNPINIYGSTKFAAEGVADIYNAKVVRLSRCFNSQSKDISEYLTKLENNEEIYVPKHFIRSYCHIDFAAHALWEYAGRFDKMPQMLHIATFRPISFLHLMILIADEFGYDTDLISGRSEEEGHAPRPLKTGLDVSLAQKLGLPIYSVSQSIEKMKNEQLHRHPLL